MRGVISSFACFLALATSLPAQPKEEVIYPRGSVPAGTAAPVESRSLNSSLLLTAAVLAAAAGWWIWQKRRSSLGAGAAGAARLAIVESRSLGSRQYLVVADYDGRKYLLGVCPGSIEMLTPLDGGSPPPK
jgi:flagellar protein FliO/FliZ